MLANAKYIYALDMWTVEKRPNGWYFSKSAYHGDKHNWRGPYRSEMSVTLMIARELQREIRKRHAAPAHTVRGIEYPPPCPAHTSRGRLTSRRMLLTAFFAHWIALSPKRGA